MSASPPVSRKVRRELAEHGDVRVDNYYWLRDDSRSDPAVLAHLRAENDYTAANMSDVKHIEDEIFSETRGRIKEDDTDAPLRRGQYYYYERTLTGKEYVKHCRRFVPKDDHITVYDVMPIGPDVPGEHIILDENVKAEGHAYYSIGAFKVSPSGKLVAYGEDTNGDETYTLYVIDAESGKYVGQPLKGVTSDIEWAGDDYLAYITMDSLHRPDKPAAAAPSSTYSGPRENLKPGQTTNSKSYCANSLLISQQTTLRHRPEARAAARATGVLDPPNLLCHSSYRGRLCRPRHTWFHTLPSDLL